MLLLKFIGIYCNLFSAVDTYMSVNMNYIICLPYLILSRGFPRG